jgi:RNA polymerase sigma-70 factor (ECF subfamily)
MAPIPVLDDGELARRAGDRRDPEAARAAFRALYDRYAPRLVALLAARLDRRPDVEDAALETWLRIVKALGEPSGFDGRDFKPWAFEMSRIALIDAERKKRASTLRLEHDNERRPRDAVEPYAERKVVLSRCLKELRDEERTALEMRYVDGIKPEEIAKKANVPPERVQKLLHRVKAKLAECTSRAST